MSSAENASTKDNCSPSKDDVDKLWNTIREEVNINKIPKSNHSAADIQSDQIYGQGDNALKINSTPTMVFSVIGDSDSFVPRPWPKTVFQTALIEAAKSGGETWILFRKNNEVVSNIIQEAYEHYEDMEFGKHKHKKSIGDPQRHIKLINIAGKGPLNDDSEHSNTRTRPCKYTDIKIGEEEDKLLEFEKHIAKQKVSFFNPKMNIKMPVPIAIIVCEGDLRTIVHIAQALNENIPVIIMKGSGKAADLVLDYIYKNDEFRKKASISFGIQFDNDKYGLLERCLGEIIKHKDLVGVFDLDQDDPLKLSNIVGETVVSCWSMKHVISTAENVQDSQKTEKGTPGISSSRLPEYGPPLKGFSLTWKFLQKNSVSPEDSILEGFNIESRRHVLNPQYSTPTSLPLYFYFVYQLLQESKGLEKYGPTLLLEALKANRCDYVRVLLAKGVKFRRSDLPELYRQTVACDGCKSEPPCFHMEWILKQFEEKETETMCQQPKYFKSAGNIMEENSEDDSTVADAAEALCCKILGYEKCTKKCDMVEDYNCSQLMPDKKELSFKNESTISDILLWTMFANRKELAEICWLRCENHLLTGLVCTAFLNKLSKKANNIKEQILSIDLEEHSKLFEGRCIALMNKVYNENAVSAIDLMDDEAHVWGIHSSPLTFAYENFMYDVVAHTCSQKNLNKQWYNDLPPDLKPFVKILCTKPKQLFTAPLTKFVVNYVMFFIMLLMYSTFVLTSISTEFYVQDKSKIFDNFVYIWCFGDLVEEVISCFAFFRNHGRSKRSVFHRIKRYANDFWNAVDILSYFLLLMALLLRHVFPSQTFTNARRMFSLSLLVMYLRFLEVFLVHRKMGPTLIMIKEMLKDLLSFLSIAVFVILGVGIYYHANLWPDHQTMWSGDWTNWRIWTIIYYPYWQLYGDLNLDYLDGSKPDYDAGECTNITSEWESDASKERCPEDDWTIQAVAALYLLFSNLLLVNLVIAMFSYTFERVQKNSEKLWRFERYTVINDYGWRIPSPFNLILRCCPCCYKTGKCCPSCKIKRCCSRIKKKEEQENVNFRRKLQKIIALRNHSKI